MKKIIKILLVVLAVAFVWQCFFDTQPVPKEIRQFEMNLGKFRESDKKQVKLADLTPFEWEKVCTIWRGPEHDNAEFAKMVQGMFGVLKDQLSFNANDLNAIYEPDGYYIVFRTNNHLYETTWSNLKISAKGSEHCFSSQVIIYKQASQINNYIWFEIVSNPIETYR